MTFCEDKGIFSRCFAALKTNPKRVYWKRTKEGAFGLIIHISREIENMQSRFNVGNVSFNEKSLCVLTWVITKIQVLLSNPIHKILD